VLSYRVTSPYFRANFHITTTLPHNNRNCTKWSN